MALTDVNALISSQFVRVKLVAFIHFIFIANALMGYLPGSFIFYNILFIISLFWTLHHKDSIDAVHTALLIDICSIFFDIIILIAFFYRINGWAIAFTIINLICRPFSCILLHKEFTERGGTLTTGQVFPTNQQRSYQDIDKPNQPIPTNNQPPPNVSSIF